MASHFLSDCEAIATSVDGAKRAGAKALREFLVGLEREQGA
jgi:hypothetical protein